MSIIKGGTDNVWSSIYFYPKKLGGNSAARESHVVTLRVASTRSGSLCFGLGEIDSVGVDCKPGDPISFLPLMWMAHTRQFYFRNRALPEGTTRGITIEYNNAEEQVRTGDVLTIKHDHLEFVVCRQSKVLARLSPVTCIKGPCLFGLAMSEVTDHIVVTDIKARATGTQDPWVNAAIACRPSAYLQLKTNELANKDGAVAMDLSGCPAIQTAPNQPQAHSRVPVAINLAYPGLTRAKDDPRVYEIKNFLSAAECQALMRKAEPFLKPSQVAGKANVMTSQFRTSYTCYFERKELPNLIEKARRLLQKPIHHCELPQVARYYPGQFYRAHQDAFNMNEAGGRANAKNGGQRVATLLIYLNDVKEGGATDFPTIGYRAQPEVGKAVVFFPCFSDGVMDARMLHAAMPAKSVKWVSQIWVRQSTFVGCTGR